MASDKAKTIILSLLAFSVFVTFVVLSVLNTYTDEFHDTLLESVHNDNALIMSLSFDTYSALLIICYVADFLWIAYALSCICRQGSGTGIFSFRFFAAYVINLAFSIGLSFVWLRDPLSSFIVFIFKMIFLALAFGLHSWDLAEYLSTVGKTEENKCDVWYHRFVVQNSLLFTLTSNLYIFIDGVSVFLHKEMGVDDFSVSLGMIIFLGVLSIVWFTIEGFVIRPYVMYTFSAHLATIYYLSSIISPVWALDDKTIGGFVIFFLVANCVMFVVRVFLLAYRSSKRGSYENITYNVRAENVDV